jgi:hypothetical protein
VMSNVACWLGLSRPAERNGSVTVWGTQALRRPMVSSCAQRKHELAISGDDSLAGSLVLNLVAWCADLNDLRAHHDVSTWILCWGRPDLPDDVCGR